MNKFFDLIKQTYRKKSIHRILMNWAVFEHCRHLKGIMIDMGSGKAPSYQNYWRIKPTRLIRLDINPQEKPDVILDLNNPLPFAKGFADVIFLFNVLYIVKDPEKLIREAFRALKKGGNLFLYSPFIFNESREPDDYARFTSQKLAGLISGAGFQKYHLATVGERFTAACYLADKILLFNTLKLFVRMLCLFLDKIYPQKLKALHPCPMGYFVRAVKQ